MISAILQFLLGIEPASWAEGGQWRLRWLAAPSGDRAFWTLAALTAAVVGLYFLYRWEGRRLSRSKRLLLVGLRLGVALTVLVMLFEPIIVLSKREWAPSNLLILLDNSQSMGLRDAWQDDAEAEKTAQAIGLDGAAEALRQRTRLQLAAGVLDDNLMETLQANGGRIVHLHTFAERLSDAPLEEDLGDALAVEGQTTAIGSSIRQALLAYRGMPLSGVLVISDGQSNAGESAASAARLADDESVPIVALAVGTAEGPRNVGIFRFETDPVVFVRDTNRVTVYVQSRGMSGAPAVVTLQRRRANGDWVELGQEEIILDLEGQLQSVAFDFTENLPGKLEFRARISDAGPELTTDDNLALAEVRVIRQKLRVLFIAGSTFPEVQFLRNGLMRDRGIELSTWLMAADETYEHPGNSPIRRLPTSTEELDEFDCILLYDPDPAGWSTGFGDLLTHYVARAGGGLVLVAGEMQTAGLFDHQTAPDMAWLSLLPVVRQPGLFRSEVQVRLSAQNAWKLLITEEGVADPIFAFADDEDENQRILKSLPGMYWHFPVTRAKPGATVLARHGDPRMRNEFGPEILLATQRVGPGRTFFVGFDSTYRWRFLDEQFFDGFWARLLDRAGRGKQLGGVYPFRLETDRPTYQPGDLVRLVARFTDPDDVDPGLRMLYGEVERGDQSPLPIALTSSASGQFEAEFTVAKAGPHLIRVWPGEEAAGAIVKAASLQLGVALPNLEYETPTLDRARLETVVAGGRVYGLDQIDQIPDGFPTKRVVRVLEDRHEIWDAPLFYGLLFVMLVAEWLIRKRYQLI